jgi:asparagine synthase (glutamine-hydrolysing)
MASLLPEPILSRSSKGTPSTFVLTLMRQNTEQIREMLNYGMLAEHGLVDTGAVNASLDCPDDPAPATYARMMALTDVEAWLQSWRG